MSRVVLIDGNSIMNRAFYGIMSTKMLMTEDGTYTNAVYGFLAIFFRIYEDLNPDYVAVAFDLKAPTERHKMYEGYKANRHAMPNELASQMPILKEILKGMNITIIEKEGYEADDILGTLSKKAEEEGKEVTILSGDRDNFQLASDKITIRIPRTKMGKTEIEDFDEKKIIETYGVEPKQLIEVKGLQGDTSDNIPGVPGVGEKTALAIIKEYKDIKNMYKELNAGKAKSIKGKTRQRIIENKELAMLSRKLGTINTKVPLKQKIEDLKVKPWDNEKVLAEFKRLRFYRYIERFNLKNEESVTTEESNKQMSFEIKEFNITDAKEIKEKIIKNKKMFYYIEKEEDTLLKTRIKKQIVSISIQIDDTVFYSNIKKNVQEFVQEFKEIFESEQIEKIGYKIKEDYVILKELGIELNNIKFDVEIAAYILNPTENKYEISKLAVQYLGLEEDEYLNNLGANKKQEEQINLFDSNNQNEENKKYENAFKVYIIYLLEEKLSEKLKEINSQELFENIEMPVAKVLAKMQYEGMYLDKEALIKFGNKLKERIEKIRKEICDLAGEEFNVNSTQQLGTILFEKLNLTSSKKNKKGYSTDVEALEKIKNEHPIVEKILEYRGLMKLNSTYVDGMLPYINEETKRIHSYFHQTVTSTGRISSTEPNLQNIPTRYDLGKKLRKVFKPKKGYIFVDADYSQIELRVLAHISQDIHMLEAFKNGEDIHKQAASKVLGIPIEKVTKGQRTSAKAVNFGIVYGISDFGLAEQLGVSRKEAKKYIEQYLEKYEGIDTFMKEIVEKAKQDGYVETLFHRRRYIPELKSNNYMVRQFGSRAAMNTPIQGTAADIMKIAMVNLDKELQKSGIDAKIILQVHDELILEVKIEDKEAAKELLKKCMENAKTLSVPLEVEVSEANNWYEAK